MQPQHGTTSEVSVDLMRFSALALLMGTEADFYSGSGTVDFEEFVSGLSAFSSKGGREEKMRCEFAVAIHVPLELTISRIQSI